MPKMRLSRSSIDKIDFADKQTEYYDTRLTGFGLRVNMLSKTYFVKCRTKNERGIISQIKETIGRVDIIDFEKAYNRAKDILEDAANGIAPMDKRSHAANLELGKIAAVAAEAKKDITLQAMLTEYMKTRKKLKQSTKDLYQADVDRYISDWKDLPLRSIDGAMILAKHEAIGAKTPSRADHVMRVLRAVFNHAMTMYEDVIMKNPVKQLSAVEGWYKVPARTTYLKPTALKAWLPEIMKLGYDTSTDFILMMLFQGSRLEETGSLKWKDIDLKTGTAVFRETKTGVVLEVPLSRFIVQRLKKRAPYYCSGPESYVFPSYGATGHILTAFSSLKAVRDKTGVYATHHDLRRSFISYCEELDITIFTRKRLANHAIPLDVTEGYTMHNIEKLRGAVEKIAAFILSSAGMPYNGPVPEDVTQSPLWEILTEEQKRAYLDTKKAPQGVISLEAEKVRRRMAV